MKHVYALVGFDSLYLDCVRNIHRLEKEAQEKRFTATKEEMDELVRTKNAYHIPSYWMGPNNLAFFETQEDAIKYLEKNPSTLHEERYTLMIIEKVCLNTFCFMDSEEPLFYEYYYVGSTGELGFREIRRPEYLIGTCGFAS